jgi:hypothetical protein
MCSIKNRNAGRKAKQTRSKIISVNLVRDRKHEIRVLYETMFERASERQGIRTRIAAGSNHLKLPMARTELRKNSFAVRTINQWNSLPEMEISSSAY